MPICVHPWLIYLYHSRMKQFLVTLPRNFIGCFKGRMIVWHLVAILLTVILVLSGFDWRWFLATHDPALHTILCSI
ncbi:MAG: hypothetical protein ACLP2Y_07260 [Limisphaerales bacterium]